MKKFLSEAFKGLPAYGRSFSRKSWNQFKRGVYWYPPDSGIFKIPEQLQILGKLRQNFADFIALWLVVFESMHKYIDFDPKLF